MSAATDSRRWAHAYLKQARADLAAVEALVASDHPSVFCMLLQMTFEKLAKAVLLFSSQASVEKVTASHAFVARLIDHLKRNRHYLERIGGQRFAYDWDRLKPWLQNLERANPAVALQRLQHDPTRTWPEDILEYPWYRAATDDVCWPEAHLDLAAQIVSPLSRVAVDLPRLARTLANEVDSVFG